MEFQLQTPVAFLIFNRPDTTQTVFEEIRRSRPPKLLVVADGPRADRPGEAEKCLAARAVIDRVDWPCEVLKNYSEVNLGCRQRVSSGLNWVFETLEEAIILEDDCLPHPTFFRYCEELLTKYRNDERIMLISGDNFQSGRKRTDYSYYFSSFAHIWGWASWRRAWKYYDVDMKLWPEIEQGDWLMDSLRNKRSAKYWANVFDRVYRGQIVTWDYQWLFACWMQSGMTVLPNANLISNLGFGSEATHTAINSPFANLSRVPMLFPLRHPHFVVRDTAADALMDKTMFRSQSLPVLVSNKLKGLFK